MARSGRSSFSWMAPLLLAGAVLLAYANSFHGPFVFDDVPAIVENPTLRHPSDLGGLLAPPGDEAGTVGGRPLVNASLAFNYALGKLDPWGYHAFNFAVHAAASLLLFGLVRRVAFRVAGARGESHTTALAFFTALLWAVHPLQTEAVTYVVQRAESLMALFYLLTLYCFVRSAGNLLPASTQRRWETLAVTACLAGMATKEVMVTAPLLVLLLDRAFFQPSIRSAVARRPWFYGALASTWILLAILVAGTHGRGGTVGPGSTAGVWPYFLTQCGAIIHYVRLAFWPTPLVFDYGTRLVERWTDAALPGGLLLLGAAGALLSWRRWPAVGFSLTAFLVILAPSSSFVPVATEPMAEHRVYLPLAALIFVVVAGLFRVCGGLRRGGAVAGTICALIGAGLAGVTAARNHDYRSEVALWSDTVSKVPGNPRAHNNLAEAWQAAGDPARAAAEFAAAVAVDPDYLPARYNLGVTQLDQGKAVEAIPNLRRALAAPRHRAETNLFLAEALEKTGQTGEAVASYREAVRLDPTNPEAAFGLGNTLAAQGELAAAVDAFRRAAALAPDRARIRNNLANALLFTGRIDEAIEEYRAALKLDPANGAVRDNLERALQARREH